MAYNNPYNPYGNISGVYPNNYQSYQPMQVGQPQSYAMQPQSYGMQPAKGIDWVDGEAAARAKQLEPGIMQHAMWDINEPVIYIKSVNPMGMPNPLQKVYYRMEEGKQTSGQIQPERQKLESGDAEHGRDEDMSQYVRKDEMEAMKEELKEAIRGMQTSEARGAKSNGKSAV